ncbi:MAG: hypothetical protein Q7S96_04965 [bacterium]|nr:hypothetical protein [bacterium]
MGVVIYLAQRAAELFELASTHRRRGAYRDALQCLQMGIRCFPANESFLLYAAALECDLHTRLTAGSFLCDRICVAVREGMLVRDLEQPIRECITAYFDADGCEGAEMVTQVIAGMVECHESTIAAILVFGYAPEHLVRESVVLQRRLAECYDRAQRRSRLRMVP